MITLFILLFIPFSFIVHARSLLDYPSFVNAPKIWETNYSPAPDIEWSGFSVYPILANERGLYVVYIAAIEGKVDVYSFGIVVLEILCGRRNFVGSEEEEDRHLVGVFRRKQEEGQLQVMDLVGKCSDDMQSGGSPESCTNLM